MNVFLVSTVAGSVITTISRLLEEPTVSFKMLADGLPKVSGFFCCYLLMKGLSGMSMELARVVPAAQHILKRLIYPSATARDRRAEVLGTREFDNPGWFPFGKYCGQDLLIVVVTMSYACLAPVILLPAMVFFSMAFLVYKHQLLFVYLPIFESGGLFWPKIYRRWIFAMFLSQATMTGMFLLKYAYAQMYFQLALMVLTMAFKMKMENLYTTSTSVSAHLPLELATSLDAAPRAGHHQNYHHHRDGNRAEGAAAAAGKLKKRRHPHPYSHASNAAGGRGGGGGGGRLSNAGGLLYNNNTLSMSYDPTSADEFTQPALRADATKAPEPFDPRDSGAAPSRAHYYPPGYSSPANSTPSKDLQKSIDSTVAEFPF